MRIQRLAKRIVGIVLAFVFTVGLNITPTRVEAAGFTATLDAYLIQECIDRFPSISMFVPSGPSELPIMPSQLESLLLEKQIEDGAVKLLSDINFGITLVIRIEGTVSLDGTTLSTININNKNVKFVGSGTIIGNSKSEEAVISVINGGNLTIDGITVTHPAESRGGSGVYNTGTFRLVRGRITGNNGRGVSNSGGIFIMEYGTIDNNQGGVSNFRSIFKMLEGVIEKNTASFGAGVWNSENSEFIMEGGAIRENEARSTSSTCGGGGVYTSGTFNMNGGNIYDNSTVSLVNTTGGIGSIGGQGGGIHSRGVTTITGGSVFNNTAARGGGIWSNGGIDGSLSFSVESGQIKGNSASEKGGGVYIAGGNITFDDGYIEKNHAPEGGGIFIDWPAGFTMRRGRITNNSAAVGSGIYVDRSGGARNRYSDTFWGHAEIKGGIISDNNNIEFAPGNGTPPTVSISSPIAEAPSAWATEQVIIAISVGLVPDTLQSKYTQATTRAEFCALAVALYETVTGTEINGRTSFNDTTDINVQKLASLGVVSGVGNNNFAPDQKLTREQAATMLSRLSAAMGKPMPKQAPTFADNSSISPWAVDGVGEAQAAGIMSGVGNNLFAPMAEYTREQSIVTMMRLMDFVR